MGVRFPLPMLNLKYMNRQKYNRKIYQHLAIDDGFNKIINKYYPSKDSSDLFFTYLDDVIESHPDQRFGQIMCNYVIKDYRDSEINDSTTDIKEYLFPGNPDPFFEESHYTYYRLTGEIPEDIKKELDEKKGKKVYFKLDNGSTGIGVLSGVCINPWRDEWNWKIDDKKLISTNIHLKLL